MLPLLLNRLVCCVALHTAQATVRSPHTQPGVWQRDDSKMNKALIKSTDLGCS